MKSQKKILKNTIGVMGLVAIPTAAALGLSYGIKDDKVNLSLAEATCYGETYFDNKIVRVTDDDFAANILYDSNKRNSNSLEDRKKTGLADRKRTKDDQTLKDQQDGDLAGLVRLDRKLDVQYANSLINMEDSANSHGRIGTDGSLEFDFNGIQEQVKSTDGKVIFGKDMITDMETDAKTTISKSILKFRRAKEKEARDNSTVYTKTNKIGIFFDKNVVARSVSIYLYELKDFDPEQEKVINKFVDTIDKVKESNSADWLKRFHYNDAAFNNGNDAAWKAFRDGSHDRVDGVSETGLLDPSKNTKQSGFPEFFGASNILTAERMHDWYDLGGVEQGYESTLFYNKDGKLYPANRNNVVDGTNLFESTDPDIKKLKKHVQDSPYIKLPDEASANYKVLGNVDDKDTELREIGASQFTTMGIIPTVTPILDFKNGVFKIVYTFKSFRVKGQDETRTSGSYNMDEYIINPYKVSTYVKEIPLDFMGQEGKDADQPRQTLSNTTKTYSTFYTDPAENIDRQKANYDSLKASVVKSYGVSGSASEASKTRYGSKIDRTSAKRVLYDFLAKKSGDFINIPIVGPGLGILGQKLPALSATIQKWVSIAKMSNKAGDPVMKTILSSDFLDQLLDDLDNSNTLNVTNFIDTANTFTKEAWSDLNSLIGMSNIPKGGERTSRTFQLYSMLSGISTIADKVINRIKDLHPEVYMDNSLSVTEELMLWLKKNGIVKESSSLMDIIGNYKTELGTIVETISINRPVMKSDLIQKLVDFIPLPLFAQGGSQFNRDTAAVLGALLNGNYIKKTPTKNPRTGVVENVESTERIIPTIINLLNGNQRTSVQTFFSHIMNDNPAERMQFIEGVLGADLASSVAFTNAIDAIITMLKAKVPEYEEVQKVDESGNPVTDTDGKPVMVEQEEKDSDGKPVMILNPSFSGIGIALEHMYNDGIHSIPKESYKTVLSFIFGTLSKFIHTGTLSSDELDAGTTGLFNLITNGAGTHTKEDGTTTTTSSDDIRAVITTINAIMNRHLISPDLANLVVALMKNGLGKNAVAQGQPLTVTDLKPLAGMLMPIIKDAIHFDDKMTADSFAVILTHLFNGFPDADTLIKDLSTLVPALAKIQIPVVGKITDLLRVIFTGNYPNMFHNIALSLAQPNLEPLQKVFTNGIGNLEDSDWEAIVKGIRSILSLAGSFIKGPTGEMLDTLFGSEKSADAFVGIGHLISKGLGQVGANDIATAFEMINKLKLSFSIPNGLDKEGKPDGSPDLVHPVASMISNIMQNGIELSTLDIGTIMKLVDTYGGSKFAQIITTINKGNPEAETGEEAPKPEPDAFKNLLIDFVIGHKYVGHEGDYAKDKISEIKLPPEVSLLPGVGIPGKMMTVNVHHATGGDTTEQVENPAWWDQNKYNRLIGDFHTLVAEVSSGYLDYKSRGVHGRKLTSTELFNKLIQAQMIPNQLAAIQSKMRAANAKIQIYYSAHEAYISANEQIAGVKEKTPDPSLKGDAKEYAKSIDTLFKLMQKNMLAASSQYTVDSLRGIGKDKDGHPYNQVSTENMNEYKALYFAVEPALGKLNDLLDELNSGVVGANFEDRMTKIFNDINSQFSSEHVKGVMPGMPAVLKNMLKDFFALNTAPIHDTDDVAYVKSGFDFSSFTMRQEVKSKPSTAASAFAKFLADNWKPLFDRGGVMSVDSGQAITRFLGGPWGNPVSYVTHADGGPNARIKFSEMVTKINKAITDAADKKIMDELMDEFKKHIS